MHLQQGAQVGLLHALDLLLAHAHRPSVHGEVRKGRAYPFATARIQNGLLGVDRFYGILALLEGRAKGYLVEFEF